VQRFVRTFQTVVKCGCSVFVDKSFLIILALLEISDFIWKFFYLIHWVLQFLLLIINWSFIVDSNCMELLLHSLIWLFFLIFLLNLLYVLISWQLFLLFKDLNSHEEFQN
jgi:hypothetical protein